MKIIHLMLMVEQLVRLVPVTELFSAIAALVIPEVPVAAIVGAVVLLFKLTLALFALMKTWILLI